MTNTEKFVFARAIAETFTVEEIKEMRKKALTSGFNGKVTSWSDIGLSSSVAYDFSVATAVDLLTAAIDIQNGKKMTTGAKIRKFVL